MYFNKYHELLDHNMKFVGSHTTWCATWTNHLIKRSYYLTFWDTYWPLHIVITVYRGPLYDILYLPFFTSWLDHMVDPQDVFFFLNINMLWSNFVRIFFFFKEIIWLCINFFYFIWRFKEFNISITLTFFTFCPQKYIKMN